MEIIHCLAAWTSALSLLSHLVQPSPVNEASVNKASANPSFADAPLVSQSTSSSAEQVVQRVTQNSAAASSTATLEDAVFQQINQYRKKKGLSLLSSNSTITQQARQHSQDMANSRVFSHDGFSNRIATIGKTVSYRSAAENVAYNMGYSAPDRQAVEGWIKSTGHRRNIEGNYNLTGIGVAKNAQGEYYFTQIFIKR